MELRRCSPRHPHNHKSNCTAAGQCVVTVEFRHLQMYTVMRQIYSCVLCLMSLPSASAVAPLWCPKPPAGFRRSFRLSRRDKKTNKSMYESKKSEIYDMADVPTYEEVTSYRRPTGSRHRLVVLVGELKMLHN